LSDLNRRYSKDWRFIKQISEDDASGSQQRHIAPSGPSATTGEPLGRSPAGDTLAFETPQPRSASPWVCGAGVGSLGASGDLAPLAHAAGA